MIQARYKEFLIRIAKESGLGEAEVEKRIKQKQASLGGLVSLEGASLIVASELGIKFDMQRVKVSGLMIGMRGIDILGKVIKIYPVRTYKQKDGLQGKIGSFLIADDTGSVRVILWDATHVALLEEERIKEGAVLFLKKTDVRGTDIKELHLGGKSSLELRDEEMENVRTGVTVSSSHIRALKDGDRAAIRATIVQAFPIKFFPACPECRKRPAEAGDKYLCAAHGEVQPKFLPILNMYIDDGTASVRAVCFVDAVKKIYALEEEGVQELMHNISMESEVRDKLLGEEFFFEGRARKNALMNRTEFVVNTVSNVDVNALIEELSKEAGLE